MAFPCYYFAFFGVSSGFGEFAGLRASGTAPNGPG